MSHDIQLVDERQLVGFRARELAPARLYQQIPANDEVHRWLNDGFIGGEQLTPGAPWPGMSPA